MKAAEVPVRGDEYVIANLPVRLQPEELAMLNAAAARAPASMSTGINGETMDQARLVRVEAARLLKLRRQRERVLGLGTKLLADPAWNILLDLFVRRVDEHVTSVSSACIASGVAATTALRYIAILIENGFIIKNPSPTDQRVQYVTLSDEGFRKMVDVLTLREEVS